MTNHDILINILGDLEIDSKPLVDLVFSVLFLLHTMTVDFTRSLEEGKFNPPGSFHLPFIFHQENNTKEMPARR